MIKGFRGNRELVRFAKGIIDTAELVAGGYLLPTQAKAFIKLAFESPDLLPFVRTIMMPSTKYEIDKIGIGKRLLRGVGSENEDQSPYTKKPIFGKLELDSKKYALPWEISEDSLEDNIEGQGLEATIAGLMSNQLGLDTEDIGVGGDIVSPAPTAAIMAGGIDDSQDVIPYDTLANVFPSDTNAGSLLIESEEVEYTGNDGVEFTGCIRGANGTTPAAHVEDVAITWKKDDLMGTDDGWIKIIQNDVGPYGGAHLIDGTTIASGHLDKAHFFEILNALPKRYKRSANKKQLRWVISVTLAEKWKEYLSNRATSAGDSALLGKNGELTPLGIPALEVGAWPDDKILLTHPKNLIAGIWRKVKIRKATQDRTAVATDTRYYQATVRQDFQVEEVDACAMAEGIDFSWT